MTAGKTYIFDEHYRKWAMTSGEWRGGEHFYLPDEFRLSLYTKNSAGELVSVADFQNQPQYGWQAIQEDDDDNYQPPPSAFLSSTVETLFNVIDQLINLFDNAHFFPPGSQHRNACTTETSNACGLGWDIRRDHGRQLRTASYTPSQSGTYYLQVTRIRDDQPVFSKADGWSITFDDTSITTTVQGGVPQVCLRSLLRRLWWESLACSLRSCVSSSHRSNSSGP